MLLSLERCNVLLSLERTPNAQRNKNKGATRLESSRCLISGQGKNYKLGQESGLNHFYLCNGHGTLLFKYWEVSNNKVHCPVRDAQCY